MLGRCVWVCGRVFCSDPAISLSFLGHILIVFNVLDIKLSICFPYSISENLNLMLNKQKYWGKFTKVEGETGYERTDCEFNTSSIKISKIKQDFIFWIKLWKNKIIIWIYQIRILLTRISRARCTPSFKIRYRQMNVILGTWNLRDYLETMGLTWNYMAYLKLLDHLKMRD